MRLLKWRALRVEILIWLAWARFTDDTVLQDDAELRQASAIGRVVNSQAGRLGLFRAVCPLRATAGRWALTMRGIQSRIVIGTHPRSESPGDRSHVWSMDGKHIFTGTGVRKKFLAFSEVETVSGLIDSDVD